QQGLVLQVAEEDVLFVVRQVAEVDAVLGHIHFLRAPEERQLLLDQLLEDRVFLLVVARHVDRLAEEHRLAHLVVVGLGKGTVFHFHAGPSGNLKSFGYFWECGWVDARSPSPSPGAPNPSPARGEGLWSVRVYLLQRREDL